MSTLVTVLFLLAACTATPATPPRGPRTMDVNDSRITFMRDEPLVARDTAPSIAPIEPGHRLVIKASLFDAEAQNPSEVARKRSSDAMLSLRENKWVIYFAACAPPGWTYTVYGYKIVDAVSYNAVLEGSGSGNRARLSLRLIAPHSSEPSADAFADRPAAIEPGKSCLEVSLPPAAKAESGVASLMADTPGDGRR